MTKKSQWSFGLLPLDLGVVILIVAVFVSVVVLCVGIELSDRMLRLGRTKAAMHHAAEIVDALETTLGISLDVERTTRDYGASGEIGSLAPYRLAVAQIRPALARLQTLTRDEPALHGGVERLG